MVKLHFTREPLHRLTAVPLVLSGSLCPAGISPPRGESPLSGKAYAITRKNIKKEQTTFRDLLFSALVTRTGIELNFSHFLICRDMENSPYLRRFFSFNVFYNPVLYRNFSERVKDKQRTTLCAYSCYYHFKSRNTFLNTVKFTVICDNGGNNHEQI